MCIAELNNVSVRLGTNLVLDKISVHFPKHQISVVMGASGSGKSTLLQTINALLPVAEGEVKVLDMNPAQDDVFELRKKIGFGVQDAALFPHLDIQKNIELGAKLAGWEKSKIAKRTSELLQILELSADLLPRYPHQISGGQQQRVSLGRALMLDPELLLLDEPFSALDPFIRADIHSWFCEVIKNSDKTVILISHDIEEARRLADFLVVLRSGTLVYADAMPDTDISRFFTRQR